MDQCTGRILNVAADPRHGFSKVLRRRITLIGGHGVEGDAHAGEHVRHRFLARVWPKLPNRRQIHLIGAELFDELLGGGHAVGPGDLGENVTTRGIGLESLPLGTRLHLGSSAVIELTGLRTPCGLIDRFQRGLRSRMVRTGQGGPKFKCGVLGIVVAGGQVLPGDSARVEIAGGPMTPLPAL